MSHWNYRLCKKTHKYDTYEEVLFSIHEAYYNKAGGIWAITEESVNVYGDSIDDVKQALSWMNLALSKETIDLDTLVFDKPDNVDIDESEFNKLG